VRVVTLASGSKGNCTLISDGGTHILIDAGISARRISTALAGFGLVPSDIAGVFITHEHGDHVCGLATLTKRYRVPLFAPGDVARYLCRQISGAGECVTTIQSGEARGVCGLEIAAFHTPHDTPESVGYTVRGSEKVSLCTDFGHVTDEIYYALEGSAVVVLESNHDEQMLRNGEYPFFLKKRILSNHGHLSNDNSARLAASLAASGTRGIILAHLSDANNTPELARRTTAAALESRGFGPENVMLEVAPPDRHLAIEVGERVPCLV